MDTESRGVAGASLPVGTKHGRRASIGQRQPAHSSTVQTPLPPSRWISAGVPAERQRQRLCCCHCRWAPRRQHKANSNSTPLRGQAGAGGRAPRPRPTVGAPALFRRRGPAGGMREEPPLTVSEAAASTTSFKDQSRAVDGPEPSTTGVGAADIGFFFVRATIVACKC